MELVKIRNSHELSDHLRLVRESRMAFEKNLLKIHASKEKWHLGGFCEACNIETKFLVDWNYSNGKIPNFRERLVCASCGLNNRQRFMVRLMTQLMKENNDTRDIYLYEQVTYFYSFIRKKFKDLNVVGSEYLGMGLGGQIVGHIRHEDALNLSFDPESFDFLISNDVFEHVPNIHQTLSECNRVLREHGFLLISIPFTYQEKTIQRAVMENGVLRHILPEQYHGNPLSDKGSLVFYDYGWDFLDFCRSSGFKDAHMLGYYSYYHGYIGDGFQLIFIAQK